MHFVGNFSDSDRVASSDKEIFSGDSFDGMFTWDSHFQAVFKHTHTHIYVYMFFPTQWMGLSVSFSSNYKSIKMCPKL